MASLTWTKEDGTWGVKGIDFNLEKLSPIMYGALSKLKDYEAICDSPDKLKEIDELYREKCEEVNALKAEKTKVIDELVSELTDKNNIMEHDIDDLMENSGNYDSACNCLRGYIEEIAQEMKAGE